jgi:SAM-dependent methyltransferase
MGIPKIAYCLLAELKRDYPNLGGTVLQMGRQDIGVNASQVFSVLNSFHLKSSIDLDLRNKSYIDDISLFKSLGFDSVESIDFSDYEQSTYTHDFNQPAPEFLHGRFDAIYDGGTTEHIFDFPESLRNIYRLLKVGGIVMHASPSNNFVDHGFYSFSPTVFYDYYRANGFEIIKSCIFEIKPLVNKCFVYEYSPEEKSCLINPNGFDDLLVWFVARKIDSSTCDMVPQQHYYANAWEKSKFSISTELAQNIWTVSGLKKIIAQNRFLYSLLLPVVRLGKRIGLLPVNPPVIAVYDYM